MPFTASHPAIILPLTRLRSASISASCLIVGSITPDFEYFLTMKLTGRYSHTLAGAFFFDLPVAWVLVLVFHSIVKGPLIDSLPGYFYRRLNDLQKFDFFTWIRTSFIGYTICLLAGIFSHLFWDSFTHANEFFVERILLLSRPVQVGNFPEFPLFRYLQHISTGIGALYILYFFHHQPATGKSNPVGWTYWMGVIIISSIAFLIRGSFGFEYYGDVIATIIASILLAIVIMSSIRLIQNRYRQSLSR
jgi:hypothetical protein